MTQVLVEFEEGIFSTLGQSPEELAREIKVAAAIFWYAQGRVSQGRAAELAGLSRTEFLDALSRSGVSACQETLTDLDDVLAISENLPGEASG